MKSTTTTNHLQRDLLRILSGTAVVLLLPLIAMQFTDEVNWDLFDFMIIGALLLATGLSYVLLAGKLPKSAHRAVLALLLVGILVLIWAELAVGIFGTPFAGN